MQHRIAEETEDNREQHLRKPLVTTKFVQWSCKKFAQPMMKSKIEDVESITYHEKEWRYLRYLHNVYSGLKNLIVFLIFK